MDTIKNFLSVPADMFGLDPLVFGGIVLVLIILIIALISTLSNMPKQRKRPGGPKTYGKVTPPNRKTTQLAAAVDPAAAAPSVTASMDKVGGGVVSDLPLENTVPAVSAAAETAAPADTADVNAAQYDEAAFAAYYSDPHTIAALVASVDEIRHTLSEIGEAVAALESAQNKSSDSYMRIRKRVKAVESKLGGAAEQETEEPRETAYSEEDSAFASLPKQQQTAQSDTAAVSDIFSMESIMQVQPFSALPDENGDPVPAAKKTVADDDFGDLLETQTVPAVPLPAAPSLAKARKSAPPVKTAAPAEPAEESIINEEISALSGVADYNKFAGNGVEIIKFPELSYADIMTDPGLNSPLFISGGTQHSLWVIGDPGDTRSLYPNPKNFSETETAQIYEIRGTSGIAAAAAANVKITVIKPAVLDSWDQVNEKGILRIHK